MQTSSLTTRKKIRDYYYVTKPNVISLLVFSGAAGYVASAGWHTSLFTLFIVAASVWLGSASANTIGSYFDRDIDAIMRRTSRRPIPTGTIRADRAAEYGLVLLASSLALAFVFLGWESTVAMFAGFVDYTLVYSYWLKRRTWANILLGGFSGIMPVLVGYFAARSPVIPIETGLFMGFLVFFWIPEHIWSLAVRYKEDYQNAKIPMLPVVTSDKTAIRVIAITSLLMIVYSFIPVVYPTLVLHSVYLSTAAILGGAMLALNVWLLREPSQARAWTVFKFSSPYLLFVFIGIVADILVYTH